MSNRALAESCARVAHAVNNSYNAAIGDPPSPAWEEMTDAQREGTIRGAEHALAGGGPEDSHNLWLESRAAEGWTYGPVKDFAAKTSPCFLPYNELPAAQRHKDAIFQGAVRGVAAEMQRLRDLMHAEKAKVTP